MQAIYSVRNTSDSEFYTWERGPTADKYGSRYGPLLLFLDQELVWNKMCERVENIVTANRWQTRVFLATIYFIISHILYQWLILP